MFSRQKFILFSISTYKLSKKIMDENNKYIPDSKAVLRAIVAAIPWVGGAVDHLIFDKAESIRNKNIEQSLNSLSSSVDELKDKLNQPWFESEEALQMLKKLFDAVSFETDKNKIDSLGKLVALCGTHDHAPDSKKCSVLDHIAKLSYVQIKLLTIISSISPKKKEMESKGLVQTATAIWVEDIVKELNKYATNPFWDGILNPIEELEILESLNTIRRIPIWGKDIGYSMTSIGKLSAKYLVELR